MVVRHRGYPPLEPVRYLGPPCLTQTILGRELQGTINYKHVVTNKFYSRIQLYFRSVGHLSAVYCMLFDRTGKYVHHVFCFCFSLCLHTSFAVNVLQCHFFISVYWDIHSSQMIFQYQYMCLSVFYITGIYVYVALLKNSRLTSRSVAINTGQDFYIWCF